MFSRGGRGTGRHARDDRSRRSQSRQRRPLAEEVGVADERAGTAGSPGSPPGSPSRAGGSSAGGSGADQRRHGPYDSGEAPAGVPLIDLGSLRIPSVAGVEVRVQTSQQGTVSKVYLVHGESVLQLEAFAAPRTEPLWEEVRTEIREQMSREGVAAEESSGEHGVELLARVRSAQGLRDLRFVGVDGPRWLLRAIYQGPAATDPASAAPLAECLRGVVVSRDEQARPVKEPLPLRLSDALAAQLQARAGAPDGADGSGSPGRAGAAGAAPTTNGVAPRRRPSPHPRRD